MARLAILQPEVMHLLYWLQHDKIESNIVAHMG